MQRRTQPPKASTTLHYGRCACGHALNRRGERAPDLAREWEDKTAAPLPRSDAAITYQALPRYLIGSRATYRMSNNAMTYLISAIKIALFNLLLYQALKWVGLD